MKTKIFSSLILSLCILSKSEAQVTTPANLSLSANTDYSGWDASTLFPMKIKHEGNFPINFYTSAGANAFNNLRATITSLPNGAPMLPFAFNAVNNPLNPLPGNQLTRIGMSRDGASPVTRPLSVLHIGYDWPYPFIAQGGFRYWQDIGIMTMALTDNMYSGLRKKDPVDPTGRTSQVISPTNGADDDQDAVIS